MKNIVIAAGYATRLGELTKNFPKPLLEVGGKSILDWLLDDLDRYHVISRFAVITNSCFADHFRRWRDEKQGDPFRSLSAPMEILDDGTTSNETRLGAVRDLLWGMESLGWSGETLVLAGDNLLDFSLGIFLDYFRHHSGNAVMRYREPDPERTRKCGVLEMGEGDRVLSMEEKPDAPKSDWCVPPFYAYRNLTPEKIRASLAEGGGADAPGSLLSWFCRNEPVFALEMPGCRFDVGNLAGYQRIRAEYRGPVPSDCRE